MLKGYCIVGAGRKIGDLRYMCLDLLIWHGTFELALLQYTLMWLLQLTVRSSHMQFANLMASLLLFIFNR